MLQFFNVNNTTELFNFFHKNDMVLFVRGFLGKDNGADVGFKNRVIFLLHILNFQIQSTKLLNKVA